MLLTYSKMRFVDDIRNGSKKHTFRSDPKKRWKPGMAIQHWFGNPRNTRAKEKPFHFLDGHCFAVQEVLICRRGFSNDPENPTYGLAVFLDGQQVSTDVLLAMAENDGLSIFQFREWFVPTSSPTWTGRIIHFTPGLTYTPEKVVQQ